MRVSPINNNNNNTKFGVLKIDKKTILPKLTEVSSEYINSLDEIGKKISSVTRFNVVLKDSLKPQVLAEDKHAYGYKDYFKELKEVIEPRLGKAYYQPNSSAVSRFPETPDVFIELFGEKADAEYKAFQKLDELSQAATYSELLDKRAAARDAEEELGLKKLQEKRLQEEKAQEEHRQQVAKLMEIYGEDVSTPVMEKEPPRLSALYKVYSFFEKLFS